MKRKYHSCQPSLPCFHCHPITYIRLVQHLIERCLLLKMHRDECVWALAKHACIHPVVTLTVWKGLQKENIEFFQAYNFHATSSRLFMRYTHKTQRFGRRNHHLRY
ncbi:putative angiotensin-converting enzyme 2 [Helianthus anomalus]